jgi:hypothetical protein
MLLFAWVLGERRWLRLLLFAVLVPVVAYTLFSTTLHVPLPLGWLENTLRDHGLAFIFR